MSQTTPSGADVDVLTVLNRAASFAARGRLRAPEYSARQCAKENREDQAAIAAVAALIARNAELEVERDALAAERDKQQDTSREWAQRASALAAENKALRDVVAEYIAARDYYEAATKTATGFAHPPIVSHGDPRVLRYRAAREALARTSAATTKGNDNG